MNCRSDHEFQDWRTVDSRGLYDVDCVTRSQVRVAARCQCQHKRLSDPRKRKIANGGVQYWVQCLSCGKPMGSAVKAVEACLDGEPEPFDVVLYEAGKAATGHFYRQKSEKIKRWPTATNY